MYMCTCTCVKINNKKSPIKWGWISNNGKPLWWKSFCTSQIARISYKCRMFSWNLLQTVWTLWHNLQKKCSYLHENLIFFNVVFSGWITYTLLLLAPPALKHRCNHRDFFTSLPRLIILQRNLWVAHENYHIDYVGNCIYLYSRLHTLY